MIGLLGVVLGLLMAGTSAMAATPESVVTDHIQHLRAIQADADPATISRYNQQMDSAWKFFDANKAAVLPLLRIQLDAELRQSKPADMVLLDVGYYLMRQGTSEDRAQALSALLSLDPDAPVVARNAMQLFDFTHRAVQLHDPRVLPLIDKAFLRKPVQLFIPAHHLKLDATLVCVFLYGAYGDGAEKHLRELVMDPAVTQKVMEVLGWIGTPASVPDVEKAYAAAPSYDAFIRMTSFMMRMGGLQGREVMLRVKADKLDEKSRAYFLGVKSSIDETSFARLRQEFGAQPSKRPSAEKVRARLAEAYDRYGADASDDPPTDFLDAQLPADEVITMLLKIRARALLRVSDEALGAVEMGNVVVNTLRYR